MSKEPKIGWYCYEVIGVSVVNPRAVTLMQEEDHCYLYNQFRLKLGMLFAGLSLDKQIEKLNNRLDYDYTKGETMTFMEDVRNRIDDVRKLQFDKDIGEDKAKAVIEAFNNLKGALKTLKGKYNNETSREPELTLLDELQHAITDKMMELYNASNPETAGKLLASILNVEPEDGSR